jgi:uncharacterized protein YjiS (DUF1127 family)
MAIVDVRAARQTTGRTWQHFVMGIFEQLVAAHVERRKRRRQIAELRSLGPGALKDIGIDRSEISSIVHGAGRDTSRIGR